MSLITETINSRILKKEMKLAVYCPDSFKNKALPVLYFLHGRTGNENLLKWLGVDKTADLLIENGKIKPLIIVCPNMDNSRGINSAETYQEVDGKYGVVHKGRYEDYLLDEVIPFIDSTFQTIEDRSARYIGGISSGGYTALNLGLRHQELFSRIGGHMPAIDLSYEDEDECYFSDEKMAGIFQEDDKSPYDHEAGGLSFESLVPVLKAELLESICVYAPKSGIIMVCQIPA